MTATSPYLNHPARSEREAVLEAALRDMARLVDAGVIRVRPSDMPEFMGVLGKVNAALSTTASRGGDDE